MADLIYINGNRVYDELPLRSLFYGEGVFETFRYKSGLPVHFDKHMKRLEEGAEVLHLEMPGKDYITALIDQSAGKAGISDLYVKLCILSEGSNSFYEISQGSQVLILVREYQRPKDIIKAGICSFNRNSSSPILKIKSFNYLENIIARREAMVKGFDEALFLNERGNITEGSAGNIFWYKAGTLYTPSVECGILPGTTREILLEIKDNLGLRIEEGGYSLGELISSEFAFFTNSLIGSVPVSQIDNQKIPMNNPVYTMIQQVLVAEFGWI